jgi:hypothetical protein
VSSWPVDHLESIATGDALHVAPFRTDGTTYGTPTWIWSVAVGGELYVRAYNGTASRWYQAATIQRGGRIRAAGHEVDVSFETVPADADVQPAIDAAYRMKYADSAYLAAMISGRTTQATVRIRPA